MSSAWEDHRGDEQEAHFEAVRRREEAKRAVAAEVVAERMTLWEAAGQFRRLDEADLLGVAVRTVKLRWMKARLRVQQALGGSPFDETGPPG